MSERRQILTLVGMTLMIGVAAVALISNLPSLEREHAVVEEYKATFYPDGKLAEEYTYTIRERKFSFLFRFWEDPLSAERLDHPYIEPLEIEEVPGAAGYYKDHQGTVSVEEPYEDNSIILRTIRARALQNEAGSYKHEMYDPGTYTVRYMFDIHPPLEYDDEAGHLNLKLASEHITYKQVTLVFEDAGYIERLYPHPPSLSVEEEGGSIIVRGSSRKDELIEVEMLIDTDALGALDGFPRRVEGVRAQTVNANRLTSLQYSVAVGVGYGVRAIALIMPLLLYWVYSLHGREREYTVPQYLSYVPNRGRKPWVVNQIFKSGVLDYDDDGFYATLIDLHRRGKIRIETKPAGLLIKILNEELEDVYERRVMGFLQILAEDGVVDTDRIEVYTDAIKSGELETTTTALSLKEILVRLTTEVDEEMASEFIIWGRRRLRPLIALTAVTILVTLVTTFAISYAGPIMAGVFLISVAPGAQLVIAHMFPETLFGRWRGDGYREKLEWDAFTRHISDLSQMRKYAPEDISMWGEWLVYGTALGVGDAVVRAMKMLEIDIPEASYVRIMPVFFHPFIVASRPSRTRGGRAGGFRGGGFGGGRGFGGGGGGVR